MTEQSEPQIVRWPSDDEMRSAFDDYALALGKVIHAWNYLLEQLAHLFVVVVGDAEREILLQIWHVPDNDRVRIDMLEAAAKASSSGRWLPRLPTVRDDLIWLAAEAKDLINARNDATHGLATLSIGADGTTMGAHPLTKHKRAANLAKRGDLLVEFDRLERWAEGMSIFTQKAETALYPGESYPWPERPRRPDRQSKKDLLARSSQALPQ